MADQPHPKFPNPTIAEATCEFTFNREAEPSWSSGEAYKVLQDQFPEIQPIGNMALQIIIGPVAPPPSPRPPGVPAPAFRFASKAGDRAVQMSDTNFIHAFTGSYPGWDNLKASILAGWMKVLPIIRPKEVTKVGLRYINRIVKDEKHPQLRDWLSPTDDLPATLIASRGHYLGRIESTTDDNNLKLITISSQEAGGDAPVGAIIFDIDRIRAGNVATDVNTASGILDSLHEDIWQVFWSARTQALVDKLNGRS